MLGFVDKANMDRLLVHKNDFNLRDTDIEMVDHGLDYGDRTARLDQVISEIYDADSTGFGKWCPETTPVVATFGDAPFFELQRAAVGFLGVLTCGVHLNVYRNRDGIPFLQIARRASHLASHPDMLDQCVAGFLPVGENPREKLVEEAYDEAGLESTQVAKAKAVSSVEFAVARNPGLQRGAVFVFDLEIPEDTRLRNFDGEVDSYLDIAPQEAAALVMENKFKFDSGIVAADFLLRHGYVDCENTGFLTLSHKLRNMGTFRN